MNRIQKVLGSAAVALMLAITPMMASAQTVDASSSTGVVISPNGIVRVIGADVTSVSNGVVSAVTTIGNVVMNWVVNVSASTKIGANGSASATTTDIQVGDKIGFAGTLSSSVGSTLTVAAAKIRDITNFPPGRFGKEATSTTSTGKNDGDKDDNWNGKSESPHGIRAGLDFLGGLHLGLGRNG